MGLECKGCRFFNLLPPEVRSMCGCSVEMFKKADDDFISEVLDSQLQFVEVSAALYCSPAGQKYE